MCCVSRLPNRDALMMHAFESMLRIKHETKRLDGNLIRSWMKQEVNLFISCPRSAIQWLPSFVYKPGKRGREHESSPGRSYGVDCVTCWLKLFAILARLSDEWEVIPEMVGRWVLWVLSSIRQLICRDLLKINISVFGNVLEEQPLNCVSVRTAETSDHRDTTFLPFWWSV